MINFVYNHQQWFIRVFEFSNGQSNFYRQLSSCKRDIGLALICYVNKARALIFCFFLIWASKYDYFFPLPPTPKNDKQVNQNIFLLF